MLPIAGKPMLEHVVRRVSHARLVDEVVIATSTESSDDTLADYCLGRGWNVTRGSEEDVLSRYVDAARRFEAEIVVRITSDCPLMDPEVLDLTVTAFMQAVPRVHYAANTLEPRTFPRGLDVEVISMGALERAFVDDQDSRSREHVTPYIYRNPNVFKLLRVANDRDLSRFRLTVDTTEDLALANAVYDGFETEDFNYLDAVAFLERSPLVVRLNAGIVQKQLKETEKH